MILQVDQAKEILSTPFEQVTILGVLLLIIAGLIYVNVKLVKRVDEKDKEISEMSNKRLEDAKEFAKEYSEMNVNSNNALNKVLTMLEIMKNIK